MVSRSVRVFAAAALLFAAACTSGPGPVDLRPYNEEMRALRAAKDQMLRTDTNSPIPAAARATFAGLPYYDVNPDFRAAADLSEASGGPAVVIAMQQTDGTTERMRKIGSLSFTLRAVRYALTAFAEIDDRTMDRLFVPFGDLTNGSGTYKGGRFLNLRRTPTGLYDLDFNQAYHPYCVYNPAWICPVPPQENRLPVAIAAGERLSEK